MIANVDTIYTTEMSVGKFREIWKLMINPLVIVDDFNNFTSKELEVIEDIIEKLSSFNATQINEYFLGDMPWKASEDNEVMNYSFVFYRDPIVMFI